MAVPKRKQSKQRSRLRRGANRYELPQMNQDSQDGTWKRPHFVNPFNGMYNGRKVIDV